MILGIGIDLCRIERIRRSVNRFGDAWIEEVFTSKERNQCLEMPDPGLSFACGFACKEACAKALGTGFADQVRARDIELSSDHLAIVVTLQGDARKRLGALTPRGHKPVFLITTSNNAVFVSSTAILQAIPSS